MEHSCRLQSCDYESQRKNTEETVVSCGQGLGRTRAGAKTPKFRSRTLNASFSDCKTVLVRLVLCPRGKAVSKVAEAGDFRLLSASLYPQSPLTMCITKRRPHPATPCPPTAQTLPRYHTCVSAARRGIEAARPWLSSPGCGSPSGPRNVMFCIWTSTAWRTASPSVTHHRAVWPHSSPSRLL